MIKKLTIFAGLCLASCQDMSYGEYDSDAYVQQDLHGTEEYEQLQENEFIDAKVEARSTFSIDVDNASYTIMRSDLSLGRLPVKESVRVEEYINFFDYNYQKPGPNQDAPFRIDLEMADSAFGDDLKLLRVAIQGKEIPVQDMKASNIVFLVDTSGSMAAEKKLPLVKKSLKVLLKNLRPSDTLSIVTYASSQKVVLAPTPVSNEHKILKALAGLQASGGTYGEGGIKKAFQVAESARKVDGNNRIVICTDGDFNLGLTGKPLLDLIEKYRKKQIAITAIGFGRGNYKDATMESLASASNGNYFYIDNETEAQRVFGDKITSTLEVIAADVKIQLEFDPKTVDQYRLIGYENRLLDKQDFANDLVDAGEVGPGHNVTAFYEIKLKPSPESTNLASFRIRYKDRFGDQSKLIEKGIKVSANRTFEEASRGFRFGAAVVEYAEILRESKHLDEVNMNRVVDIATTSADASFEQQEFLDFSKQVRELLNK